MTTLNKVVNFLNETLEIDKFSSDSSHNGLQVQGFDLNRDIKKVGVSVDASLEFFKKAKANGCDLLIVHHGIFWNHKETITGHIYQKVKFLIDNNISLYAVHLPLDKHIKYGNNANIVRLLGGKILSEFDVGYVGEFKKSVSMKNLVSDINSKLNTSCQVLEFGKKDVKKFAVISGGAAYDVFGAINLNVDAYITGEISHGIYHPVLESKMNFISAGHYATETIGVKELMPLLKKQFSIPSVFIDVPTGL